MINERQVTMKTLLQTKLHIGLGGVILLIKTFVVFCIAQPVCVCGVNLYLHNSSVLLGWLCRLFVLALCLPPSCLVLRSLPLTLCFAAAA